MQEIGGYIELDKYAMPMLHENALALNCARNALAYLIRARQIKSVRIPRFCCDSVLEGCVKADANVAYYSIGKDFLPENLELAGEEWLYVVNYYGQISNAQLQVLIDRYKKVIVDNVQAYFQAPLPGADTLYSCRKFFGVADGAFLYTQAKLDEGFERDESYDRMRFLLGRFERTATEFYGEYIMNNELFSHEPIKRMSKLTNNLLHAIDYDAVRKQRTQNFRMLHRYFDGINHLRLAIPEGAFMYPLYVEGGAEIRKKLQAQKIYIPTLWPDVFKLCRESDLEYDMANNILPLPVDQRYDEAAMQYVAEEVMRYIS